MASVRTPRGVIVAGMHRSGTSLVTSVFTALGWSATGPLLAATATQPRGHFEDMRMLRLHNELLEDLGTGWSDAPTLRALRRSNGFSVLSRIEEVRAAVAQFTGVDAWAWKNPRAALFLDDWARLFPDAVVVLCVRSPASVVDSMLRRKNGIGVTGRTPLARIRRVARGVSVWHTYTVMGYRFAKAHPERVVVVRVPEDLDQLAAATTPSLFEPSLLRSRPRAAVRVIAACAVTSQLLLWRTRRLSDPQRLASLLRGPHLPSTPVSARR